jgi:hypothetical protein
LAGEAAAEHVDVWHRHGQRSVANVTAVCSVSAAFAPLGRFPASVVALDARRPPVPSLRSGVGHKGAHVWVAGDAGPVAREDALAEGVLLAEPHSAHTGALEAEVEPSDA